MPKICLTFQCPHCGCELECTVEISSPWGTAGVHSQCPSLYCQTKPGKALLTVEDCCTVTNSRARISGLPGIRSDANDPYSEEIQRVLYELKTAVSWEAHSDAALKLLEANWRPRSKSDRCWWLAGVNGWERIKEEFGSEALEPVLKAASFSPGPTHIRFIDALFHVIELAEPTVLEAQLALLGENRFVARTAVVRAKRLGVKIRARRERAKINSVAFPYGCACCDHRRPTTLPLGKSWPSDDTTRLSRCPHCGKPGWITLGEGHIGWSVVHRDGSQSVFRVQDCEECSESLSVYVYHGKYDDVLTCRNRKCMLYRD